MCGVKQNKRIERDYTQLITDNVANSVVVGNQLYPIIVSRYPIPIFLQFKNYLYTIMLTVAITKTSRY